MSMDLKFDASGVVTRLRAIATDSHDAAYVGAQAAAQVFYDEAKVRVPVASGKLRDAIYQVQSKDNSTDKKAVYHISWNARKAPHGHLVEYGTSRAAAHPFIRPAYEARKKEAIAAAKLAFAEKLNLK